MKLEEFVKGLKVGKYLRLETPDENCRDIIIWRAPVTGEYYFASDDESYGDFETPEALLECLKTKWLEYDYEIYKSRAELKNEIAELKAKIAALKNENAKLGRALKNACEIIEGGGICSECPANIFCFDNLGGTCAEKIYNELMKEAGEEIKDVD